MRISRRTFGIALAISLATGATEVHANGSVPQSYYGMPESTLTTQLREAQTWLSFLTPNAQKQQLVRLGMSANMFDMNGGTLEQDLRRFELSRRTQAAAQAAHNRGQERLARDTMAARKARDQAQIASRERLARGAQRRLERQHQPNRPLHVAVPYGWDSHRQAMWVSSSGVIARRFW